MDIPVGSLVVPAPAYRDAMKTGEGGALLLAVKRGSGHLYYPGSDRSFWVPMRHVREIPEEALPEDCLERLLSSLILSFDADEVTIREAGGNGMRLAIGHPGSTRDHLRRMEEFLGPRLQSYALEPGSMRVVTLVLELVSLPEPAGGGR